MLKLDLTTHDTPSTRYLRTDKTVRGSGGRGIWDKSRDQTSWVPNFSGSKIFLDQTYWGPKKSVAQMRSGTISIIAFNSPGFIVLTFVYLNSGKYQGLFEGRHPMSIDKHSFFPCTLEFIQNWNLCLGIETKVRKTLNC